ncbi:unnamed protein product, partial [Rotaria sp. Silwood1]
MATIISSEKERRNLHPNEIAKNKEDIQLIWLDQHIDDSGDCQYTQSLLIELNPAAQFYSDVNRCLDLIKSIKDEFVFLIISGAVAREILPKISTYRSIVAIFIFCSSRNRQYHVHLLKKYDKIVDIFTDQDALVESIQKIMNLIEKQILAFNLFDQKQKLGKDLSKESASFILNQMLIYVLKQMPQDQQSKYDMLRVCTDYYRDNSEQLTKIDQFRKEYTADQAVQWYTDECFLYKLLNKALRTEDLGLLYIFRFFVIDLCAAIETDNLRLREKSVLTLFRGANIPNEELEKLERNKGQVISTNGFLSTSRSIEVSLRFIKQTPTANNDRPVLFEIEADPTLKSVTFADIEHKTRNEDEEEVLFNLNTLFEIGSVNFDSRLNLWKIKLITTDRGSEMIQEYLTSVKKHLDDYPPIIYFGQFLLNEMGQVDQAGKYFQLLLDSLPPDHENIADVYSNLGNVHSERNELNLALKNYELAYTIRQKLLSSDHPHVASSLQNIGTIYKHKGCLDQALHYCQQALTIFEKNYPNDHVNKAINMEYIGRIYTDKDDFDTAL